MKSICFEIIRKTRKYELKLCLLEVYSTINIDIAKSPSPADILISN